MMRLPVGTEGCHEYLQGRSTAGGLFPLERAAIVSVGVVAPGANYRNRISNTGIVDRNDTEVGDGARYGDHRGG